jgi:hypothetical protein
LFAGFLDRITPRVGRQGHFGGSESQRVGGVSCSIGVRARDPWSEVALRHLRRLVVVAIGAWHVALLALHAGTIRLAA